MTVSLIFTLLIIVFKSATTFASETLSSFVCCFLPALSRIYSLKESTENQNSKLAGHKTKLKETKTLVKTDGNCGQVVTVWLCHSGKSH